MPNHNRGSGSVAAAALAAAAASAAAGYYFYATKNAKKHRQAASTWARGMKKQVVSRAKSLRTVDAKTVARIVDDAAAAYQGARGAARGDVRAAAVELKRNWSRIKEELEPSARIVRAVKKATKGARKATPKKKAKKRAAKKRAR